MEEGNHTDDDIESYVAITTLSRQDALPVAKMLTRNGVRVALEPDNSRIQSLSTIEGTNGGTFGAGATLVLRVHPDDVSLCEEAYTESFEELHGTSEMECEAPVAEDPKRGSGLTYILLTVVAVSFGGPLVYDWWSGPPDTSAPTPATSPSYRSPSNRPPPEIVEELSESDDFIKRTLDHDTQQEEEEPPIHLPPVDNTTVER